MKLLSFVRLGKPGFGAVVRDGIVDMTGKLDPDINTLKQLISLNMEDQAEEYIAGKTKDLSFSSFNFSNPISINGSVSKISSYFFVSSS